MSWPGRLHEGDGFVKVIQRHEYSVPLGPLAHSSIAGMSPREDLDTPPKVVHPLEGVVKASAFEIPGSVSGQEDSDALVAVVVQRVLQHAQLQEAVRHVLLTSHLVSPIKQADLHALVLHSIPELAQFGGDRARS